MYSNIYEPPPQKKKHRNGDSTTNVLRDKRHKQDLGQILFVWNRLST